VGGLHGPFFSADDAGDADAAGQAHEAPLESTEGFCLNGGRTVVRTSTFRTCYFTTDIFGMESLIGFNFESVDYVPDAINYKEIPFEHMQLLGELEKASQDNNLSLVVQTYVGLRRSNARPAVLRQPGSALRLALESKHEDTVKYLLSEGVQVSSSHVRLATEMRAKSIIELFLQYGWPVNERLGWSDPPALA